MGFWQKIQDFYIKHKKACVIGVLGCITVLIVVILLLPNPQTNTALEGPSPTVSPNSFQTQTTKRDVFNPLINNNEVRRVEKAYTKKYQQAGKTFPESKEYKFDYKLSPELKKDGSFLFPVQSAFAASMCNIDLAPKTVPVYTLKAHYTTKDAQTIASEFDLSGEPASLPMEDGSSFQYFFSDKAISKFLHVSEPSGAVYYHKASPSGTLVMSADKAKALADAQLLKQNVSEKMVYKTVASNPKTPNEAYAVSYMKDYGNFSMTDAISIKALGMTKSVCSVIPTETMNTVQVMYSQKGDLSKMINKTRKITKEYSLARQTLEESMNEYKGSLPILPVVLGSAPQSLTDTVTIDEAVLVWYDYGEQYAQLSYVPMYLTSGKTDSGSRVLTLFPSISKAVLATTPIPDLTQSKDVLQLGTFIPAPPKSPPPTEGGLCFGNLIDYTVTCTQAGATVCDEFIAVPTNLGDPYNVCQVGCKNLSGVITLTAGSDPCIEFLKKNGITLDQSVVPFPGSGLPIEGGFSGGDVSCVLNGCPC